jgi:hypothetical protein
MNLELSVLDQSPVPEGATAADALAATRDLAQFLDLLGFTRYWRGPGRRADRRRSYELLSRESELPATRGNSMVGSATNSPPAREGARTADIGFDVAARQRSRAGT